MKFYGSSGIRMVWNYELIEIAKKIAQSIGMKYDDVLIASDFRTTSNALTNIMMGYMLASGCDVYYGGKVPTPTLAYATKEHEIGIMVTASHNPPEYNGIKLWNPDGSAVIDMPFSGDAKIAAWNEIGMLRRENILETHRDALLKRSKEIDLKIVVDCANGATSVLTPFILRDLGAKVITLNCHPDGYFPGHPSEPTKENLKDLINMVKRSGANLGIAHDGDGDRFLAVTERGRFLSGDEILAIFIKHYGFEKIVAPVDSSMLLENFAKVIRCKVGDANVSQMMKSQGVRFGGENSGTQIFADWRYTPDAIYSAIKFAEIAMRENIDEIVESFPTYYTIRKSVKYRNRNEIERKIEEFVKDYDVEKVDGYRVKLDDAWFLIRFSGTEPKVRITVESAKREKAERIMKEIISVFKNYIM